MENVSKSFQESLKAQNMAAETSGDSFLTVEPMLFTAFSLVVSGIYDAMQRNLGISGNEGADAKDRLLLSASFYQGMFVAERLTRESYYSQAASVIRQQLESLAAIIESKNGRRVSGKTPNVSAIGKAFGPSYGNLSQLAHVSVPKKLQAVYALLSSDPSKPVTSIVPLFHHDTARSLYALNIVLMLFFACELHDVLLLLYGKGLAREEISVLDDALALLDDIGALSEVHLKEVNNTFQRTLDSAAEL